MFIAQYLNRLGDFQPWDRIVSITGHPILVYQYFSSGCDHATNTPNHLYEQSVKIINDSAELYYYNNLDILLNYATIIKQYF